MDLFSLPRRLISERDPRNHLLLGTSFAVVVISTLLLAPEQSAHGDRIRTISSAPNLLPVIEHTPVIPENVFDGAWTDLEVQSGDNLSALFTKVGLNAQDMYKVLNSSDEAKILNTLYPGYQLSFQIPEPGKLTQLKVLKSPLEGYLFTLEQDNYKVETITRTADIVPAFKEGNIVDSLFLAGQRAQIPAIAIMDMADIFGGVIDFILDPRAGDSFSILYEEKYLDGKYIGNGDIIAAQFINEGKQYTAVRYVSEEGKVGYFNADGESMRKAFLRTPLDVFRISSNFNLQRKHPILNTIRAHRGTDYAAPRGTPVRATADGVVTWAARNGSFGKLIVIQHDGKFETKYAHLNDYGEGIKKGARVRQGEIIGFVGTTGSSTGPHLHYEFLVNGVHKDPRTMLEKMPETFTIDDSEMPRFRAHTEDILKSFKGHFDDSRILSQADTGIEPSNLLH